MKGFKFCLIIMLVQFCSLGLSAQELSSEARQFRTNLLSFLREEGFSPTTDNDGKTVNFKREGENYWIMLSGSMPVQVNMHIEGFSIKDANNLALLVACNKVNTDKYYVKAFVNDFGENGSANIAIEMPCHTAEEFRYVFFDCVKSLAASKTQLQEEYNKAQEELDDANKPFEITACSVANQDKNGNNITAFGNTIYSYNTKYLTPRIEIQSQTNGTFTVYYKLYLPNGTMSTGTSSPSGYTSSKQLSISTGTHSHTLLGWGSDTSGNWKAGDYRYEFYCNGVSLGYYNFTIK